MYKMRLHIYIFTGGKTELEIVDDLETKLAICEDEKLHNYMYLSIYTNMFVRMYVIVYIFTHI
jgi:hypothetical protein